MYPESDLIPLSALQHCVVCPGQSALIDLEALWIENGRTAKGRVEHERVDRGGAETYTVVSGESAVIARVLR